MTSNSVSLCYCVFWDFSYWFQHMEMGKFALFHISPMATYGVWDMICCPSSHELLEFQDVERIHLHLDPVIGYWLSVVWVSLWLGFVVAGSSKNFQQSGRFELFGQGTSLPLPQPFPSTILHYILIASLNCLVIPYDSDLGWIPDASPHMSSSSSLLFRWQASNIQMQWPWGDFAVLKMRNVEGVSFSYRMSSHPEIWVYKGVGQWTVHFDKQPMNKNCIAD